MLPDGLTIVPGGNSEPLDLIDSGESVSGANPLLESVGVGGVTVVTTLAISFAVGVLMELVLAGDSGFGGGTESTMIGFGSGGGGLCDRFAARFSDKLLRRLLPPKILCDFFP